MENKLEATKHDQGKPDYTLISKAFSDLLAEVLGFGKKKYGRNNYRQGFHYTRVLASLGRHLKALEAGEDYDPESGIHHLGHIAANVQMMVDNLVQGTLEDDRWIIKDNQFNITNPKLNG